MLDQYDRNGKEDVFQSFTCTKLEDISSVTWDMPQNCGVIVFLEIQMNEHTEDGEEPAADYVLDVAGCDGCASARDLKLLFMIANMLFWHGVAIIAVNALNIR